VKTYLNHRLTGVWAFLVAITIVSWLVGRDHGGEYRANAAVTACVLAIAALKSQLVLQHFMEVGSGPVWLKRVAYGWVAGLSALVLVAYFGRMA
jgi:cytochrome c oxidase subunit IV